jgi:hypothetical protein
VPESPVCEVTALEAEQICSRLRVAGILERKWQKRCVWSRYVVHRDVDWGRWYRGCHVSFDNYNFQV